MREVPKWLRSNLTLCFLSLASLSASSSDASLKASRGEAVEPFIAIDVGHTIQRGGATSVSGLSEYHFNVRLSEAVAVRLSALGAQLKIINRDGAIRSLQERTQQASGAGVFVSIHHDSVQPQFLPVVDQRFSGYSIWVSRKNKNLAGSFQCAISVANRLQLAGFRPSHYHADPIAGENRPVLDGALGIFANDDLVVLKTATSAAILIEAGVIVNAVEESRLRDPAVVATQAAAIASGLRDCALQRP